MTSLQSRRTRLTFETADELREQGKYRPVVIEAHPMHATVRLKGLRTAYTVPWAAVYHLAARMETERFRAEKKAAKKCSR